MSIAEMQEEVTAAALSFNLASAWMIADLWERRIGLSDDAEARLNRAQGRAEAISEIAQELGLMDQVAYEAERHYNACIISDEDSKLAS